MTKATKWVIGIDEAGRGPLAGPVAVGIFAITSKEKLKVKVRDSKKISPERRRELFEELKVFNYAVGYSSAKCIDKNGIVKAVQYAMRKALKKLEKKLNFKPNDCKVFLDGSLTAPAKYLNQETIIKGDDLIPLISAASICAKVLRDKEMVKLSKKYANYDFEVHKGYGTISHRKKIKRFGLSPEHRRTFCAKL